MHPNMYNLSKLRRMKYMYILTADNLFLLSSCNSSILSFEILVCMHRECESYSVFDCDCRFECVFDSWKRRKAKCNFLTETLLARLVLGLNLKCCRFFFASKCHVNLDWSTRSVRPITVVVLLYLRPKKNRQH